MFKQARHFLGSRCLLWCFHIWHTCIRTKYGYETFWKKIFRLNFPPRIVIDYEKMNNQCNTFFILRNEVLFFSTDRDRSNGRKQCMDCISKVEHPNFSKFYRKHHIWNYFKSCCENCIWNCSKYWKQYVELLHIMQLASQLELIEPLPTFMHAFSPSFLIWFLTFNLDW